MRGFLSIALFVLCFSAFQANSFAVESFGLTTDLGKDICPLTLKEERKDKFKDERDIASLIDAISNSADSIGEHAEGSTI